MSPAAKYWWYSNFFLASDDFWRLLISFANSLDPDQSGQNMGPDLNPELFDSLIVQLKDFFEKVNFEKNQQTTNNIKSPSMQSNKIVGYPDC